MRGAGGWRHRPKESLAAAQPPPTPVDQFRQFNQSRDSDASFGSSRPSSSVGIPRSFDLLYKDRSLQQSALSTINSYFSSLSHPPFKASLPSAKEITDSLRFLLSRLQFPSSSKLDEDLPFLLKSLNYPFKFNKSILKAPGTPHHWPSILAIIHWLVQIALFNDNLSASASSPPALADNDLKSYVLQSYLHFARGDDDSVDALDGDFVERLERKKLDLKENVAVLSGNVRELEAKSEALRSAPSQKELLEKDKGLLEEDVSKFHTIIGEFTERMGSMEKALEEKEKELEAKVQERMRIAEENEELKRRVETQTLNARDMDRMRRELQAVERDVAEAELARNTWEEKSWDLDTKIGHQFKELEALAMECNQAMRRLIVPLYMSIQWYLVCVYTVIYIIWIQHKRNF